jgi:hypothetical protein
MFFFILQIALVSVAGFLSVPVAAVYLGAAPEPPPPKNGILDKPPLTVVNKFVAILTGSNSLKFNA